MGTISKAHAELSGAGYADSDESVATLAELEERERVIRQLLSETKVEVSGRLDAILSNRVSELKEYVKVHLKYILLKLQTTGGLSYLEYQTFASLPKDEQIERLLDIYSKESGQ
ncbi:MAG: hypothetical protein HHAS10_04830 [Candidatus Altimarinota bacterium]